jgi:hypothetical protein
MNTIDALAIFSVIGMISWIIFLVTLSYKAWTRD